MRLEAALALLLAAPAAFAQFAADVDPDWKEAEAPPPPALRTDKLIPLDMPRSALRFGVDPASVSVGADSVVRYVVVATSSSGAVNAMYEGIRCNTAEVKVYARYNPDAGWKAVGQSEWKPLHNTQGQAHSLLVARSGACVGRAPNGSAPQVVRDLSAGVDWRFRTDSVR
jgi:hypothetical protein